MKTICIAGAKGRLGNSAVRAFHQAGYRVIALSRDAAAPRLPEGVIQRQCDAYDREALIAACAGADFIFNNLNPPYGHWADKAQQLADNVMAAAREHGAVHLFPANLYNYGSSIPEQCTPATSFRPDTDMGKIRVAMEQSFHTAAEQGVQTLVIRAGDFFGDDSKGSWFDLVITSQLAKQRFTYPGSLSIPHSWAYLPDLAQAFVQLAERASDLHPYEEFLFAGHAVTGAEMRQALETAVGKPLKTRAVPWWLLKILGWFSPTMKATTTVAYLWQRPHELDDPRLAEVCGTLQHTPLPEAVRQSVVDAGLV